MDVVETTAAVTTDVVGAAEVTTAVVGATVSGTVVGGGTVFDGCSDKDSCGIPAVADTAPTTPSDTHNNAAPRCTTTVMSPSYAPAASFHPSHTNCKSSLLPSRPAGGSRAGGVVNVPMSDEVACQPIKDEP